MIIVRGPSGLVSFARNFGFQFAGALYPISWKTKNRGKLS